MIRVFHVKKAIHVTVQGAVTLPLFQACWLLLCLLLFVFRTLFDLIISFRRCVSVKSGKAMKQAGFLSTEKLGPDFRVLIIDYGNETCPLVTQSPALAIWVTPLSLIR